MTAIANYSESGARAVRTIRAQYELDPRCVSVACLVLAVQMQTAELSVKHAGFRHYAVTLPQPATQSPPRSPVADRDVSNNEIVGWAKTMTGGDTSDMIDL